MNTTIIYCGDETQENLNWDKAKIKKGAACVLHKIHITASWLSQKRFLMLKKRKSQTKVGCMYCMYLISNEHLLFSCGENFSPDHVCVCLSAQHIEKNYFRLMDA